MFISVIKLLIGYVLGVVGVNEVIYSLLMLENDFIVLFINIDILDEVVVGFDIVIEIC